MSAERNLSPTEYELLSAYIDGELTDAERQTLEERLAADTLLQRELDALRSTVNLIKLVPEMQAPRDFTLTADMVVPQNVVPLQPRRAPRTAYLSLVASVVLMLFGAVFMISETSPDSTEANFGGGAVQSAPMSEVVALLATDTPEIIEQQVERAMSEPAGDAETAEDDVATGDIQPEEESGIFLTAPAETYAPPAESGVFLTVPSDASEGADDAGASSGVFLETEDIEDVDSEESLDTFAEEAPTAVQANDAIMAEESLDLAESEALDDIDDAMAEESFTLDAETVEDADDVPQDEPDVLGGTSFSAPEANTQTTSAGELTEESLADDGIADLDVADAEIEPATDIPAESTDRSERRDVPESPVPPPTVPETVEPMIGTLEIGVGLLVGGLMLLIMSVVLFRRNRS